MSEFDRGGNRKSFDEQKRKIALRDIQKFLVDIRGRSEATQMEDYFDKIAII